MKQPDIRYNTERITEIRQDSVKHWMDKQGREHGQVRLAEADIASLRAVYRGEMDSVMAALKIQQKQIQALTVLGVTTAGRIRPEVEDFKIADRTYKKFHYGDPYLELDGILTDTPFISYKIFDSLIVTTYSKRKWFLGRKEIFLDAYSRNPAAHISGLIGLKVATEKPKRFGVGPYFGYGFNGQAWQPSIGLALQYSLIKF